MPSKTGGFAAIDDPAGFYRIQAFEFLGAGDLFAGRVGESDGTGLPS